MKILIVGLGSIAEKHIKAISDISAESEIIALRNRRKVADVDGVQNIFSWSDVPLDVDFIIISNPTQFHEEAIKQAVALNVPLFIEKPVLADTANAAEVGRLLREKSIATYVACNLRFHPCLLFINKYLQEEKVAVNEVNIYCGSDLSTWRPEQDYTKSYSANPAMGGGVHLDLIHEIDYCYWLFGKPSEVVSLKRKISSLDILSVDFAAYHLQYPTYTANITLNYYRKTAKRELEIVSEQGTLHVDLLRAVVCKDNEQIFAEKDFSMARTYLHQMQYFLDSLQHRATMMNSFDEAVEVLKIATT